MRTFILKVTTRTDYKNADEFSACLEDLVPSFTDRDGMAVERSFKDVAVLRSRECTYPFGHDGQWLNKKEDKGEKRS